MRTILYTFNVELNWALVKRLNKIDRFDASWSSLEKVEGDKLQQLKDISTVKSVGASTRIEGSKMPDDDVEQLIADLANAQLEERDEQEVGGYYLALDLICDAHESIDISVNAFKHLHRVLLIYSLKDFWHKGDFKQHSNTVEISYSDGTKEVVFKTTPPGFETDEAMRKLVDWFHVEDEIHPLIKCAVFIYEFLTIHPFQDGNGRLSRLLTTLLLLKFGYVWIQYISFEHEIEQRKTDYYRVLRHCQSNRPNEAIDQWVNFFLDCLDTIQGELSDKMKSKRYGTILAPREVDILRIIQAHPGTSSGQVSKKLNIPLSTVKRLMAGLVRKELLVKHGRGAGTNYEISD